MVLSPELPLPLFCACPAQAVDSCFPALTLRPFPSVLSAGTRSSQELATEAEEMKEKVCRLNQEVGWCWLSPPTLENTILGDVPLRRDEPHRRAFPCSEPES